MSAGAASRQALGTAVFSGMIGATILGVLFTPALYVLMRKLERDDDSEPAAKRQTT